MLTSNDLKVTNYVLDLFQLLYYGATVLNDWVCLSENLLIWRRPWVSLRSLRLKQIVGA